MPEGPLFAADDGDYAYGDDSDQQDSGAGSGGGDDDDESDDGDDSDGGDDSGEDDGGDDDPSAEASESKDDFDDSDPSSVTHCQPGGGGGGKKAAPICSVATIKGNLDACDGGTNAWANAKTAAGKDPTVQVKNTVSGFDAETSGSTITIKPTTNCCDATESLLFELHNVESQATFDKIDADAAKGVYSREDYARAEEHVEYDGLKRSWETFDKCKAKWGCGAGAKSFADSFKSAKDFDDYYKNFLSNAHKDNYRNFWDKVYKAPYEAKHKKP